MIWWTWCQVLQNKDIDVNENDKISMINENNKISMNIHNVQNNYDNLSTNQNSLQGLNY